VDICAAYGVDALHNEGWTGKGQTIVVVASYGSPSALQDLQVFSSAFGLPAPDLAIIYPDGQPTLDSNTKLGWAVETSLDLEWAHAIAPDAKLVLIAANPGETEGVQGFPGMFKGIQCAISNYPGSPISQSFAATEQSFSGSTNLRTADLIQMGKYEAIYQQAIGAGCTPLAASGDYGTANPVKQSFGDKSSDFYPYPTVSWPASSPSVTAVGGTWLQYHWRWDPQTNFMAYLGLANCGCDRLASDLFQAFLAWDGTADRVEAVWRDDPVDPFNTKNVTGGGLSAVFPTPSWQTNLPANLTQGARALPDVCWNAAVDGGVLVYCSFAGGYQPNVGGWLDVSGTSASTPQIAGLVALINQVRASLSKGPIGHLAPKLYQLPASDFNDIVPVTFGSGTNAVTLDDNTRFGSGVPGWPCTVGYDLTTGLGSPKAYNFVHDLATMFP
jgi:subtilase family serine protease